MYKGKDPRRNASGYVDPTAYQAIENVSRGGSDAMRAKRLLTTLYNICDLAGFKVTSRITIKDKKTGKEWK